MFGSNGQEKADYSRGVLERFTRRAPIDYGDPKGANVWYGGNTYTKTIVDPRKITFINNPHYMNFFDGFHIVNENSAPPTVNGHNCPVTADKIVINHYHIKSREEYAKKVSRGDVLYGTYHIKNFDIKDRNEEFDDGILRYRFERAKTFRPPDLAHVNERLFNALANNLSPTLIPTTPPQFYAGKMETFLTCRAVAAYLKTKLTDDTPAKFFEEASLKAILRAFNGMTFTDARLLLRELPNFLGLPYPVVKDLRNACLQLIPQMMNVMHLNGMWKDYVEFDYLQNLLKHSAVRD
ncbi:MAG: hypothetical protein IJL12_08440 [Selenomonadaceae bacterium]|nr:hypothetical protein [Selenomonadaceae bacterium]